jgi:hypothetical protein
MSDFDISYVQDEDEIEITDLDPQNNVFSGSLPLVFLKLARKTPLFANIRTRSTMLAWLACVIMLLFLVQSGLHIVQRQTSSSTAQTSSYSINPQYPLAIKGTTPAHSVTWIRISHGKVIAIQANSGKVVWHHCKVQQWHTPPKYAHPLVFICT